MKRPRLFPGFARHAAFAFLLLLTACGSEGSPAREGRSEETSSAGDTGASSASAQNAPYAFAEPEQSFALASGLNEISGLTALPDGRIAAVQDEDGLIFILDPETGAVASSESFGDTGDYEGIEWVEDRLFVLKSNGRLYEITGLQDGVLSVEETRTPLRGKNDTEGLGYDAAGNRLLIALKEEPGEDVDGDVKAIYAFDLQTRELSASPVFLLDLDAMDEQFDVKGKFKPSAVAVHPVTSEIYVLSATATAIAVLDADGTVRDVWTLSEERFEQPEGIAFLPDGTLFIASEAGAGPAMLYRFAYSGQ